MSEQAPTIQSERLSMRSLTSADEAFYCSLYMDAEVMRYVGQPLSRDTALEAFRKSLERMGKPGFERRVVVLLERDTQQPIGISSVRMLRGKDGKRGRAEVGTLLKPAMHEKGFAQECSTALISQSFTRPQIDELVAYSSPGNLAVERLLTDLGFSRDKALAANKRRPERTAWSITRDAWARRSAAHKSAPKSK
jgi:[ribosomal protein S5]-alanine N-acetyltransferase